MAAIEIPHSQHLESGTETVSFGNWPVNTEEDWLDRPIFGPPAEVIPVKLKLKFSGRGKPVLRAETEISLYDE